MVTYRVILLVSIHITFIFLWDLELVLTNLQVNLDLPQNAKERQK